MQGLAAGKVMSNDLHFLNAFQTPPQTLEGETLQFCWKVSDREKMNHRKVKDGVWARRLGCFDYVSAALYSKNL